MCNISASLLSTILAVTIATKSNLDHVQYEGDTVLRFSVDNTTTWSSIKTLISNLIPLDKLDIWKEPNHLTNHADVYIQKSFHYDVTKELDNNRISYKVLIEDVSKLIKRENYHKRRRKRSNHKSIVGEYANYDEILKWLEYMTSLYPQYVENITLGQTYENKDIIVYKVGNPGNNKPGIWIDAGLHAREWVAPAVSIYLINQLLTKYVWVDEIRDLMDKLDWYFLVVANPDGYEYSHNHYRFWRKNTRLVSDSCWGVDLNRNWGYQWGTSRGGEDGEPCGATYQGPSPESEQETKHVARFLLNNSEVIKAYFSLHSYTQQWFSRWAYTNEESPDDNEDLMNVSIRAVDAIINVNNKLYKAGNAAQLLYSFSGGSPDWARGVAGIKFPFLIELRDTGEFGFLLPSEQIEPTALETWAGVKVVAKEVMKRYIRTTTTRSPTTVTTSTPLPTTESSTSQASTTYSNVASSPVTVPIESSKSASSTSSIDSLTQSVKYQTTTTEPAGFTAVFATAPLESSSQHFAPDGTNTQTSAISPSGGNERNDINESSSSISGLISSSTHITTTSGASSQYIVLNLSVFSIYIVVHFLMA